MNDAGRIGFVLRGDYSGLETYDFLDVVYYNGASYVAKKLTVGHAPAQNDEFWHIFAEANLITGVKGNNESTYHTGEVNLTAEDIGAMPEVKILENVSLNSVLTPGFYYAGSDHGCSDLPKDSLLAFGLLVVKTASYWYRQILYVYNTSEIYIRVVHYNDLQGDWIQLPTGIKGAKETSYRGGNVNLTPENIGSQNLYPRIKIPNDSDLNNYETIGTYCCSDTNSAASLLNSPITERGFRLTVYNIYGSVVPFQHLLITQVADDRLGNVYIRERNSDMTWNEWRKFLTNKEVDANYVKKSGDEITGNLTLGGIGTFKRSTGQGVYTGGSSTKGWVVLIQIVIKDVYTDDYPLEFRIGGRSSLFSTVLSILFGLGSTPDAEPLKAFSYYGGDGGNLFKIKKTGTATWQILYNKKVNGAAYVISVNAQNEFNGNHYTITYPNTMLSGEPDDTWIAPTLGGEIGKAETLISYDPAVTHRNQFRGKNLGTSLTAAQLAAIRNGSFDDLYVGDYWEINGVTWRIIDINYWLNTGDIACTKPHLVIMPDTALYNAKMNDTNTTEGGYVGSKMYTENLEQAKTIINNAFGSANILNHREYLINEVTNGYPSGGAWYNSNIELPNEIMVFGSYFHTPCGNGSFIVNRTTSGKIQFALFQAYPYFIQCIRSTKWLRDVVSNTRFAAITTGANPDTDIASDNRGVQPVFGLA